MVEILKQPQFKPMHVADQVMILYAGNKGHLDTLPIKQVSAWEEQFLRYMREQQSQVRDALIRDKKMSPDLEKMLVAAINAFKPQFQPPRA
jgi:F-type H+-transporting ATPase subunit alpha